MFIIVHEAVIKDLVTIWKMIKIPYDVPIVNNGCMKGIRGLKTDMVYILNGAINTQEILELKCQNTSLEVIDSICYLSGLISWKV